jgi:two-component system chemotaxis response regulator CheY
MAETNSVAVMIVDDEQFFREVLRDMLQKAGFRVVADAASGTEAVEKYQQFAPDLVLMDIYMPEMNGIEGTRAIKALAPAAKILICSGTGYDDDINAAIQAGAGGIIYKPFYDVEVLETINTLMSS